MATNLSVTENVASMAAHKRHIEQSPHFSQKVLEKVRELVEDPEKEVTSRVIASELGKPMGTVAAYLSSLVNLGVLRDNGIGRHRNGYEFVYSKLDAPVVSISGRLADVAEMLFDIAAELELRGL